MADQQLRTAYLDLLKRALLGQTVGPASMLVPVRPSGASGRRARLARMIHSEPSGVRAEPVHVDLSQNVNGELSVWDLPPWAMTMIGNRRMDNLERCMTAILHDGIPGDVIEAGVWRGGAAIFMRGVLRAYAVSDRTVYVADSFQGLPTPDLERYPEDEGLTLHLWPGLAVSLDEVRANFDRYGLLDDQVVFVEGWFKDTLPELRGHQWSVIRLDGDFYESTMDSLENLYDGLAPGGWLIVDDYEIHACRQAVRDFRERRGIKEPISEIDWTGICWQKDG